MAENIETAMEIDDKDEKPTDKQTLLAVLQFLRKNNLKDTESLLLKEANVSEEIIKESPEDKESDVSQALSAYKREGDPCIYSSHYDSLKAFIEGSLDAHKCELAMVLYPVFVHMYLELVYNNHETEAIRFFKKYSNDQEYYYQDDMTQLSTVTKAEHMTDNQLLQNFRTSKFVIRMSRDSYTHLKRHLQENKQNLLLNIVQEHLFIDVFDGVPRNKQQIDLTAGGLMGEAKKESNKVKVYYGLLKEPDLTVPPDDDEDEEKTAKKKKPKKEMLSKKSKNDPHAPNLTRIPLPELKDAEKAEKVQAFRESMRKVSLGPNAVPSICFYTVLNAFQGVTCMDICDDSSQLAVGFENSTIKIWALTRNKLRAMKKPHDLELIDKEADDVLERMMDDSTSSDHKLLCGHTGAVYATSFSPDKQQLVSSGEDGTVRLWSLQTWTNLVIYKGHNYPVWDCKFGPRGYYFASCGADKTARLWSTDHYQPIRIFAGHLSDVDCIQFHPNCNYIATGSTDRMIRLWDILNGNCVRMMGGSKGVVHCLMFSPDGRYLTSAGSDKLIFVWDLANGDIIGQFKGHTDTIHCLCYSRDSSVLASGGLDNMVRLWNMNKLLEDNESEGVLATVQEDSDYSLGAHPTKSTPVLCVHFTRKNLLLATGPYVPP